MTKAFPKPLLDGYHAFLEGRFPNESRRFAQLASEGQRPKVMVIGCCDSRVSPEVIFDAHPGEMFVARNIANLVPPWETGGQFHGTSAALEFAVQALRVTDIVILGHAQCGGFRAFADGASKPLSPGDFIGKWMNLIAPAAMTTRRGKDEEFTAYADRLAQAAIACSLDNLMTFPWIKTQVDHGQLALHGAWFGVATGILSVRDPETGAFKAVVDDVGKRVSLLACR